MKKYLTASFIIALTLFTLLTQEGYSQSLACCKPSATQTFALLASNTRFRMAHEAPLPFVLKNKKGEDITFKTPDGQEGHGYEVKAGNATPNYLFVFHEWWGLNDYIRQMAEKLRVDIGDINVIALDLYDGKVAASPDMAGKYMQEVTDGRAKAIIQGALNYTGKSAKIYTIGWCFGGGWALQAALMAGRQAAGCVMYYGLPEKDVNRLKTLHADVLGIFANKDGWITPEVVDEFAANMKKAGKKLTVHRYDADHGFANPSSPKHNEAATKEAYAYTLQFLKARVDNWPGAGKTGSLDAGIVPETNAGSIKREDGENYILRGTVFDSASRQTLPGVQVFINDHKFGRATDKYGNFALTIPAEYFKKDIGIITGYVGYKVSVTKIKKMEEGLERNINIYISRQIQDKNQIVVIQ